MSCTKNIYLQLRLQIRVNQNLSINSIEFKIIVKKVVPDPFVYDECTKNILPPNVEKTNRNCCHNQYFIDLIYVQVVIRDQILHFKYILTFIVVRF